MSTCPSADYTLISEKDTGIYDAMNKGGRLAKGRWLYFLGADDEFINNTILIQVFQHMSEKKKSAFCYGNVLLNSNGKRYDGRFNIRRLLSVNICHQAIFVTRNTFLELGSFDTRYALWADWDFNLKAFLAGKCITYLNVTIAHYNNTGQSSVTRDPIFLKRLEETRLKFYGTFLNKFNSRIRYLAKRIRKVAQGETNTPDVQ
jgi:GT2 family glycosyltransferase